MLAQDGGFYGGWITADIEGPFKGAPGTLGLVDQGAMLITSEFLTEYQPPDLGEDANFFVVARTEGFGEDDGNGGSGDAASAGSRTARGSPTAPCSRSRGRCC